MSYKKDSGIHIVNASAFTRPEIIEDKKKDVVYYGKDNLYFNFLIDRYTGSTTNQAIINGKAKLIYGRGLSATDAGKNIDDWATLMTMIRPEDVKRVIFDRVLLGMGCFLVTTVGSKTRLSHFPMDTLRAGKADEEGNIKYWYYHPDWKARGNYKKGNR